MELIDFSKFGNTIVAICPLMTFNISLNSVGTLVKVLDGGEVLEGELLDLAFIGGVHEKFKLKIKLNYV